jgi:hypothetical protein
MSMQKADYVRCPACKVRFKAITGQIIVSHDLTAKSALLRGRNTAVQCHKCNAIVIAAIPTLYYDPDKQLAFVFAPHDAHAAKPAYQTTVNALVDALLQSLPAGQRQNYLRNPQQQPTLKSLAEAILAADGITGDVLQTQTERAKLIEMFLQSPSEAALKEQALAHEAELDMAFFELLTAYMQSAQMRGDHAGAQSFLALRSMLGQWAAQGRAIVAEIDSKLGLTVIQSREELLEKLQRADASELAALVATGHVLLDQAFFQILDAAKAQATAAGDSVKARSLGELGAAVSKLKAAHEASSQAAMQRAAALFKEVVQSDTPDQVLKRKRQEIDEAFFVVLGANIERARRQGQDAPVRALELIGRLAQAAQQERHV